MNKFFKSMLSDERGATSSKRVIGIMCALFLCGTMLANSFSHEGIKPSDTLVNAVLTLGCVCIGGTTIDKFTSIVKSKPAENTEE